MANRFFNVKITAGTSSGPYIVYHTSATSGNEATLHPSGDPAINLSYQSLTSVEGVDVMVPDTATNVILYNTDAAVIAECPTNTVVLNLGSTPTPTATEVPPTATPAPTATEVPPTATPTATEVPPTPTPSSTTVKEPTPTPSSTDEVTPTPSPTSTPVPTATPTPTPTVEPTGFCEFVFVDSEIDGGRYGIRWNDPSIGQTDSTFASLLGTATYYEGMSGTVFGVCSTLVPVGWDSQTNAVVVLGIVNLPSGGACTSSTLCQYAEPDPTATPTATPTSTPTPTPTFGAVCYEWLIDYPGSFGDPAGSVAYIDCDGIQQNDTIQPDTTSTICARQILDYSFIQQPTNIGLCGSSPTPTPSATPTPTSTAVSTTRFYIAPAQDATGLSETYCTTPGYLMSTPIDGFTSSGTYSGLLGETIFTSTGDIFLGQSTPGNNIIYAITSETYSGQNTYQRIDVQSYVAIDRFGMCIDVGIYDCSGGNNPL